MMQDIIDISRPIELPMNTPANCVRGLAVGHAAGICKDKGHSEYALNLKVPYPHRNVLYAQGSCCEYTDICFHVTCQ